MKKSGAFIVCASVYAAVFCAMAIGAAIGPQNAGKIALWAIPFAAVLTAGGAALARTKRKRSEGDGIDEGRA